jgi:hypothetical protein
MEELVVLVMATCHTEGCSMAEEPIPCGNPMPNIYCGGCGVEISDKVQAEIPPKAAS